MVGGRILVKRLFYSSMGTLVKETFVLHPFEGGKETNPQPTHLKVIEYFSAVCETMNPFPFLGIRIKLLYQ